MVNSTRYPVWAKVLGSLVAALFVGTVLFWPGGFLYPMSQAIPARPCRCPCCQKATLPGMRAADSSLGSILADAADDIAKELASLPDEAWGEPLSDGWMPGPVYEIAAGIEVPPPTEPLPLSIVIKPPLSEDDAPEGRRETHQLSDGTWVRVYDAGSIQLVEEFIALESNSQSSDPTCYGCKEWSANCPDHGIMATAAKKGILRPPGAPLWAVSAPVRPALQVVESEGGTLK